MRILVLGTSGYIGRCVKALLSERYKNVYGTYRTENDSYVVDSTMYQYKLGDNETLKCILYQTEPDYVISCMRGDFQEQLEMHRLATAYLVEKSGKTIFLSTSNVFDAARECEHTEKDVPKSDSKYGKFKIKCETMLQSMLGKNVVIIRIPEVWGKSCPRLVELLENIRHGNAVDTYKNLFINLTTDTQIAEWILYVIQHDLTGIFHVGTRDICEYITFHRRLINGLHLKKTIFNISDCDEEEATWAVIPGRSEIPDFMQTSVNDVIQYIISK